MRLSWQGLSGAGVSSQRLSLGRCLYTSRVARGVARASGLAGRPLYLAGQARPHGGQRCWSLGVWAGVGAEVDLSTLF